MISLPRLPAAICARAVLLLAALLLTALPAKAEPGDIDAAARGVVRLVVVERRGNEVFPVSHGSGFAVDAETIVTNAHVIAQVVDDPSLAIGIVPSSGGSAVYGRIISISPRNDLALVRTSRPLNLSPLSIAANPPENATAVVAIGYPMNVDQAQGLGADDIFRAQPPVTSRGFLSGRRPSRDFDTLLHTAPIARGNSGGPLVDECGRVVGVNSFGAASDATEAEFFFAVTVRELLPFLRANNVSAQMNALPCRSLDELEAAERERAEQEMAAARLAAQQAEAAEARRGEELRTEITFDVVDERANGLALTLLAFLALVGGAGYATWAHRREDYRQRKIGGGVALAALVVALAAWFTRPSYADIQKRLEERLHAELAASDQAGPDEAGPAPVTSQSGTYTCVMDTSRSRVLGAPAPAVSLEWSEDGCVNGRTQYGASGAAWSRVLVPADEDAVSVNRFDPESQEYIVERYLLDREAMGPLREVRAGFTAPACGGGQAAAADLGSSQQAILALLPGRPNERLVYDCSGRLAPPPDLQPATAESGPESAAPESGTAKP